MKGKIFIVLDRDSMVFGFKMLLTGIANLVTIT